MASSAESPTVEPTLPTESIIVADGYASAIADINLSTTISNTTTANAPAVEVISTIPAKDSLIKPPSIRTNTQTNTVKNENSNADPIKIESNNTNNNNQKKVPVLIMAIIFAIGSGNIWHFPLLCLKHSGLCFMTQYTICFLLIAIPTLYMELAIAQFCSRSSYFIYHSIVPICGGITSAVAFIQTVRSVTSTTWASHSFLLFLKATYHGKGLSNNRLDWTTCRPNSKECYDPRLASSCLVRYGSEDCESFVRAITNSRHKFKKTTPFESYLQDMLSTDTMLMDTIYLVISVLIMWIMCIYAAYKGIEVLSKTARPVLYISFGIYSSLFLISIVLPDSENGLRALFEHDLFENMWSLDAWADAASQAVFTLNLGCGGMLLICSYRNFHRPHKRDILRISFVSYIFQFIITISFYCFTAVYAGFAYREFEVNTGLNIAITKIGYVQSIIPETLALLSYGVFVSIFFFLAELLLSLNTAALNLWILLKIFSDRYKHTEVPIIAEKHKLKTAIAIGVSGFIISNLFVLNNGLIDVHYIDHFVTASTMIVVLFEIIIISYIYGFRRFVVNIRTMNSTKLIVNAYWLGNWLVVSPLVIASCILLEILSLVFIPISIPMPIFLSCLNFNLAVFLLIILYGIKYNIKRVKRYEYFHSMFEPRFDWKPLEQLHAHEAEKLEKALRIR